PGPRQLRGQRRRGDGGGPAQPLHRADRIRDLTRRRLVRGHRQLNPGEAGGTGARLRLLEEQRQGEGAARYLRHGRPCEPFGKAGRRGNGGTVGDAARFMVRIRAPEPPNSIRGRPLRTSCWKTLSAGLGHRMVTGRPVWPSALKDGGRGSSEVRPPARPGTSLTTAASSARALSG